MDDYKKALDFFYNRSSKCPGCGKDELIRSSEDNKLIISCKKCAWKEVIELPVIININEQLQSYKTSGTSLLYKLVDAAKEGADAEFTKYKTEYLTTLEEYNKYSELLKSQADELDALRSALSENLNKQQILAAEQKILYTTLEKQLSHGDIKLLIRHFATSGSPLPDKVVKDMLAKRNITKTDLDKWIEWAKLVVEYSKILKLSTEQSTKLRAYSHGVNDANKHYVVKPPKLTIPGSTSKQKIKIKPKTRSKTKTI